MVSGKFVFFIEETEVSGIIFGTFFMALIDASIDFIRSLCLKRYGWKFEDEELDY